MSSPRICLIPESVRSAAPGALDLCELAGLTLDDWQQDVLTASLGEAADGRFAAYEVGLVASRQNGKTESAVGRLLTGLFLLDERLIFSSHQFDAASLVFTRLLRAIEGTPQLERRVQKINRSHGGESVLMKSGARVSIRTRTKSGGRGHSADVLLLDEGHLLSRTAHGSLTPVVSASRRPQIWYLGTAPSEDNEDAQVLAGVRERALEGSPKLTYFEFSAAADSPADLTDEMMCDLAVWAQANPAYPGRITHEQIEAEFAAMSATTFAVERLSVGYWPRGDGLPGTIDPDNWSACEDPAPLAIDPVSFAFDVSPDRANAAIGAGWHGVDGLPRVDVIEQRSGTAGLSERIAELVERHSANGVTTDPAGPAGSLLPELDRLGVKVTTVTATEHAQACGMFYDAVQDQRLRYRRSKALDVAVENAAKRPLGDAGWAWSRKSSSVNIAPLVAVTLALWASQTTSTYDGPLLELL